MGLPSTQLAYRTTKAVGLFDAGPSYTTKEEKIGSYKASLYSKEGDRFAFANAESVEIVDPDTAETLQVIEARNVQELTFSPMGTYLLTWERPTKNEAGDTVDNFKMWRVEDGELVFSFVNKNQSISHLQFTGDEQYVGRRVTNEIQFFQTSDMTSVWRRLQAENIQDFAVSPGRNQSVAIFIGERGGAPGAVRVYNLPNFQSPVSQKTFYKADKIQLLWNKLGTSLLALTSTDVDKTGKSYYGESNLYLLGIQGQFDSRISLDKEGPIYDVQWSPNSKEFGVVYGYMPAKTLFLDARGNEIHSFPASPRNMILFSPHARFILVGGFGNLQGQIDIYDRHKDFEKVTCIEAPNSSVCAWSPDGRHILTATTSPRLRVDNGFRIWHFKGDLIYAQEMNELLSINWRPMEPSKAPIRSTLSPAPQPHPSSLLVKQIKISDKTAGAYRPPHARNGTAATSNSSIGTPRTRLPPGAAPPEDKVSRTAQKNKKKREAKKVVNEEHPHNTGSKEKSLGGGNGTANTVSSSTTDKDEPSAEDKKVRSLLKKLRAIEDLKMRQANDTKLEDTQRQKIATEASVRSQLTSLGWKG